MTDHGAFVLVNVYGPAISTEESAEERYAFKLRFYEVQLSLDAFTIIESSPLLRASQPSGSSCSEFSFPVASACH